jgi:hypothetical protein
MSKKRIPATKNQTGGSRRLNDKSFKRHHFAGVALAGGKSDKTCVAFVEYYPDQNKIFLSELTDKIKTEGEISSDHYLIEALDKSRYDLKFIGFNAPLTTPECLRCKLKCPGLEKCQQPEVQWMWEHYRQQVKKKKNHKLFTPYTERCVEQYIASDLEEPFAIQHALGANQAPLWARAQYLLKRLHAPAIEVFPKLSLWRIGLSLDIQKSHLRFHKHQVGGDEARFAILKELVRREIAFLYEQDVRLMVDSANAFDAFICAITAVLKFKGQCEKPAKGFPLSGGWIEIPKLDLLW